MTHTYVFIFDSSSIYNRILTIILQNACLSGFIPHLPGPNTFKNEGFDAPFHFLKCSNKRTLAGIYNVQTTKSKLGQKQSKVPFHNSERSVDTLSDAMYLFTPQYGLDIDPYISSMTKAIAAIKTGRIFHVIEKHLDCFQSLLDLLGLFLPSHRAYLQSDSTSTQITNVVGII